jgi:folate-binding protein YgfZ
VLVPPTSPPPDASRERARIMAGLPRHGHEISEAFNPFEVGLGHEVHLSKGCFTGQEALMRLMTYHSVRRRLARVTGDGPSPHTPHEVHLGPASAGWLTSAMADPSQDDTQRWIGLAVLKFDATEPDAAITLDGARIHLDQVFAESRPLGLP